MSIGLKCIACCNREGTDNSVDPNKIGTIVERDGKYGKFLGCSLFPICKWSEAIEKTVVKQKEVSKLRTPPAGMTRQFGNKCNAGEEHYEAAIKAIKDGNNCPSCWNKQQRIWVAEMDESNLYMDYTHVGKIIECKGPHGIFLGCSRYPNCEWSKATPEVARRREERKSMRNVMWDIPRPY